MISFILLCCFILVCWKKQSQFHNTADLKFKSQHSVMTSYAFSPCFPEATEQLFSLICLKILRK